MGGRKSMDHIDNLMRLCREAHIFFGDKSQYKDWLRKVHQSFLEDGRPWADKFPFDKNLFAFYMDNHYFWTKR